MGDGEPDAETLAPGADTDDREGGSTIVWPPPPPWGRGVWPPVPTEPQPPPAASRPDPAVAAPVRPRRRRRARVLVATLVCIATVWAAGGVNLWLGRYGRDQTIESGTGSVGSAGTDPVGAGAHPAGTSTVPATTVPATTVVPTTVPDPTIPAVTPVTITSQTPLGERPPVLAGSVVTPPDGSFAITLPPDWRVGFPRPDRPPVEEQLLPDDPDRAREVSQVPNFDAPDTQMFALSPTPGADGVLQIEGHDGAGLDNLTGYAAVRLVENRTALVDVTSEGTFDSASGPVGWAAGRDYPSPWYVVRYLVVGGDWEWTVDYWTRAPAADHALADQIVASLTPGTAST